MRTLKSVVDRFMQLLPFLTTPNSYRRFHFELFYPYPDILNGRETEAGQADPGEPPSAHGAGARSQHRRAPRRPQNRPARGNRSSSPAGTRLRPYLTWLELHESGSHRNEPFS